jgi:hypothetical protein
LVIFRQSAALTGASFAKVCVARSSAPPIGVVQRSALAAHVGEDFVWRIFDGAHGGLLRLLRSR